MSKGQAGFSKDPAYRSQLRTHAAASVTLSPAIRGPRVCVADVRRAEGEKGLESQGTAGGEAGPGAERCSWRSQNGGSHHQEEVGGRAGKQDTSIGAGWLF